MIPLSIKPCFSSAPGVRLRRPATCRRALSARCDGTHQRKAPPPHPIRRGLLGLGATLAMSRVLAANAIDIVPVSPEVAAALAMRDEAAAYKCSGGMMDCDNNRRDYAKKQMENFKKRGTAEYLNDCKREDSCREPPKDLGDAAMRMLSDIGNAELGMSSDTKMRKMGIDVTRPNVIAMP
mmetsp:Transcript_36021/g.102005  ORF Transcript_36021/g.102005 Transcript_36021/m.102005 type:complete len:180 (-) Transcript_36021:256-795(-)|eukprot:CAMPEP_0117677546 /NCGR_PEP_ID=MMETSP0804-20121206/16803_1 /TAXON_ID=1074897 /ORGANISM="Tetraselmis astigmatica, Strain CCMP880" /LENGTH=179 /DNA_ID=CAMNT_0005486837 /DNA_START=83 /DNA_END=622 /DNA_ORIENTATION=-